MKITENNRLKQKKNKATKNLLHFVHGHHRERHERTANRSQQQPMHYLLCGEPEWYCDKE